MFFIPKSWQMTLTDSGSLIMEEITNFHNFIMSFMVSIFFTIIVISIIIIRRNKKWEISNKYLREGAYLEIIWTLVPSIILILIAIPSFKLLYMIDEVISPSITIKAIGHQWYWSYEYSDYEGIKFDSYMIPEEELEKGGLRLLEVDNKVILPIKTLIRVIVTGADVIHSWALPALGIKIDGIPGRLNQTSFLIKEAGMFYGQCSELCGYGHGFMPINIKGVELREYIGWLNKVCLK